MAAVRRCLRSGHGCAINRAEVLWEKVIERFNLLPCFLINVKNFMRKLFRDQFRIQSVRMKGFDYSSPGCYFITICTKGFRRDFGIVGNGTVVLSETGELAKMTWWNLETKFDSIELDDFIFMPDHMHGIIRIKKCIEQELNEVVIKGESRGGVTGLDNPMLTDHSLGKIVRWFKGASSYYIHHKIDKSFGWHPRYFDRILRNRHDLDIARKYIRENLQNWENRK